MRSANTAVSSRGGGWTVPIVFGVSRLALFVVAWSSRLAFPDPKEPGIWHPAPGNALLDGFGRWDSGFYLGIAVSGYHHLPGDSSVAFFPLYPLLIRAVSTVTGGPLVAGLVVSNGAFLAALWMLHRLALVELGDEEHATRFILLLVAAPTAFFFATAYSESLFILLVASSWLAARRRRWLLAAGFGMFATATRLVGMALWVAVLLEWTKSHGWEVRSSLRGASWTALGRGIRTDIRSLLVVATIPLGLGAYMAFLWIRFGDPLLFVHVESNWGRTISGPFSVLFKAASDVGRARWLTGEGLIWHLPLDLVAYAAVLVAVPFVWRRFGDGAAFYTLATVLLPGFTGVDSMSRYALAAIPAFLVLADSTKRPETILSVIVAWSVLQGMLFAVFVSWRFVA